MILKKWVFYQRKFFARFTEEKEFRDRFSNLGTPDVIVQAKRNNPNQENAIKYQDESEIISSA